MTTNLSVQTAYPPKYAGCTNDKFCRQPEGDLRKYIDELNSQIFRNFRDEGLLNRSGITAKCGRAFHIPRMEAVGSRVSYPGGRRVQEEHKYDQWRPVCSQR